MPLCSRGESDWCTSKRCGPHRVTWLRISNNVFPFVYFSCRILNYTAKSSNRWTEYKFGPLHKWIFSIVWHIIIIDRASQIPLWIYNMHVFFLFFFLLRIKWSTFSHRQQVMVKLRPIVRPLKRVVCVVPDKWDQKQREHFLFNWLLLWKASFEKCLLLRTDIIRNPFSSSSVWIGRPTNIHAAHIQGCT